MNIKHNKIRLMTIILILIILFQNIYVLAEPYGIYGLNTDDNTTNIVEYILEENRKLQNSNTNVFLVGDYINHLMDFVDLEKDYFNISLMDKLKDNKDLSKDIKIPKELLAMYKHNPSVFDNPVQLNIKDNGKWNIISSIEDPYIINKAEASMRGNWTLILKGEDDTKNTPWNKFSDDKQVNFVIHEKPNAKIEYWKEPTTSNLYLTSENSFDIDFQYKLPNNGIIKYVWEYQLEDGSWHNYLETTDVKRITVPKVAGGQNITNYSLTVYDYHNATDTVLTTIVPPLLMNPIPSIISPEYIYMGPNGSDTLIINNNSEPVSRIGLYQYIFNFKSVNNFLDTTQSTTINTPSHTFAKNTLKSNNTTILKRNIRLNLTTNDTGEIFSGNKPIDFIPIQISDLSTVNSGVNQVKATALIPNSNNVEHIAKISTNDTTYTNMIYKGNNVWESNINISGVSYIYAKVENKNDSSIMYHKKQIVANRPPTVDLIEILPKHIYEGDNISATIQPYDPDIEPLTMLLELYKGGVRIWNNSKIVNPNGSIYNLLSENIINNISVGNYELRVRVTDANGEFATDQLTFTVHPLSIDGNVQHTTDWEKNRISYNLSKSGNNNSPRTPDIFFPGEKFILNADTTDIDPLSDIYADRVSVQIVSTPYSKWLDTNNNLFWKGEIWNESMLAWDSRNLTFKFTVYYSNGTIKEDNVNIKIDDDKYWRLRRSF